MIKFKNYSKYFFIILFLIVTILSFWLIKPYITAILGAFGLTYLFFPLYRRLYAKTKRKNLSAILMLILVIVIIVIPIFFIVNAMVKEALNLYQYLNTFDLSFLGNVIGAYVGSDVGTELNLANSYIIGAFAEFSKYLVEFISKFVISLPGKILGVFIMFFVMFYLFRDGEKFFEIVKKHSPFKKDYSDKIVKEFKSVTNAVIRGILVSSLIQGIIGGFGFWIFGVSNPILWGVIMFILSLLPVVGPALIWVPAGIILILTGHVTKGLLILVYGGFAMSLLDNIIRPKLISKQSKIHPIIVLLGIIGGIGLFGIVGILIGPLILALFIIFIKTHGVKEVAT